MAEVCYGEDLSLLPSAGKLSEYEKRGIRVVTRDTLENTIPFMSLRDLPHLDDGTLLEIDEAMDLYTRRFDLGLARLAELIGLMHDMGKATRRFEAYLSGKLAVSPHHHAPAGAIYAYRRWFLRSGADACARATAQIVMLCIFGHHAGLSDCLDPNGWSPLLNGLETEAASVHANEAVAWFLENIADAGQLDALFEDACREFTALFPDLSKRGSRMDAALGLVCRLLLSILVDNDRWDAACFEYEENPFASSDHAPDWNALLNTFENYRKTHLSRTDGIDRIRGEISDICFEKAISSPGVYSLSVPTGGGKTYSSLRYALRHAAHNGHSRIFYIIPYNTILDQNAKDIREALDNYPSILEHHANVVIETESEQAAYKRLTERWDSDIILTSLVQFLNACYAAPNSAARRFHRLTNAVLIFDEIQALPKTCKILFERAIQFLSSYTHSTILLCTATQPRLSLASAPVELVPQVETLHEKLKRVCFIPQLDSARTYASAGERIAQLLEEKSVLAIINTKAAAWQVYQEAVQTLRRRGHAFVRFEKNLPLSDLREAARACPEDEILCVYMSTWLCPAHRIKLIAWIQAWLKAGRRVLCVSTALIEAGINVSFPVVIRDLAGLPSLVQAAGRANRNMEYGEGKVFIWDFSEETEALSHLPDVQNGANLTRGALLKPHSELDAPATLGQYFESELPYIAEKQKFPVDASDVSGQKQLIYLSDLFASNRACAQAARFHRASELLVLRQSFRTASKRFFVIADDTTPVIVPWGAGAEIIAALKERHDMREEIQLLRRAQAYTVNVYENVFRRLSDKGAIVPVGEGGVYALKEGVYSEEAGIAVI